MSHRISEFEGGRTGGGEVYVFGCVGGAGRVVGGDVYGEEGVGGAAGG